MQSLVPTLIWWKLCSVNLFTITLSIYSTFTTKPSMIPTAETTTLSSSYSGTSISYVMMYRVNFTHLWNMDRIIVLLNDDRACSKLSIMLFQCSSMLSEDFFVQKFIFYLSLQFFSFISVMIYICGKLLIKLSFQLIPINGKCFSPK